MAELYRLIREPDRALSYYNRSRSFFQAIGNDLESNGLLRLIAYSYSQKKEYEQAEQALLQALEYFREQENAYETAFTLLALGEISTYADSFSKALSYLEEARLIANENDFKRTEHSTVSGILDIPG